MGFRPISSCSILLIVALFAPGETASAEQTTIHFIGQTDEQAGKYDPLIPDAAMRLSGMRLHANHQIQTRFWPAAQQDDLTDADYPRLSIDSRAVIGPFLRLLRQGDTFISYASEDGQTWVELSRQTLADAPKKLNVGPWVLARRDGSEASFRFEQVLLNGKPFTDFQIAHTGDFPGDHEVETENRSVTVTVSGDAFDDFESVQPGVLLSREVVGDFTLSAKVQQVHEKQRPWTIGALLAKDGVTDPTLTVGPFAKKGWAGHSFRIPPDRRLQTARPLAGRIYTLTLQVAADAEPRPIVELAGSVSGWPELNRAVGQLAEAATKAAVDLQLPATAGKAEPLPDDQRRSILRESRFNSLRAHPGIAFAAAELLDPLLLSDPADPAAHFAAAGVVSRLACGKLIGQFDVRGRSLAGAVAHLLFAEQQTVGPRSPEQRLDHAWTALACGYPRRARLMVEQLTPEQRDHPEARAIEVFASRDYRKWDLQTIRQAAPIEQLAWIWALQECWRSGDLFEPIWQDLVAQTGSADMMPWYSNFGVGDSHRLTVIRPMLCYLDAAAVLSSTQQLTEADRLTIGRSMLEAFDVSPPDDDRRVFEALMNAIVERGVVDEHVAEPARTLSEAWATARQTPVGGASGWRAMPLGDYVALANDRWMFAMFDRGDFLANRWSVGENWEWFADELIAAWGEQSVYGNWFAALKSYINEPAEVEAGREALRATRSDPAMKRIGMQHLLHTDWSSPFTAEPAMKWAKPWHRGAWDWAATADLGRQLREVPTRTAAFVLAMEVDDLSADAIRAADRIAVQDHPQLTETFAAKAPYHLRLMRRLAGAYSAFTETEQAIAARRALIEAQPTQSNLYETLWEIYLANQRFDEALALLEECHRRADDTLGRISMDARLVEWLIERGEAERALRIAADNAPAYSYRALEAHARALMANGQTDKALQVAEACCRRYPTSQCLVLNLIGQTDRSTEQILEILDEHHKVHPEKVSGLIMEAPTIELCIGLAERNYRQFSDAERWQWVMIRLLYLREYRECVAYGLRYAAEQSLPAHHALWVYNAAQLSQDPALIAQARALIEPHVDDQTYGPHIQHLLGSLDEEQYRKTRLSKMRWCYFHWQAGIEAELAGNLDDAIVRYTRARWTSGVQSNARWIPGDWKDQLLREQRLKHWKRNATAPVPID